MLGDADPEAGRALRCAARYSPPYLLNRTYFHGLDVWPRDPGGGRGGSLRSIGWNHGMRKKADPQLKASICGQDQPSFLPHVVRPEVKAHETFGLTLPQVHMPPSRNARTFFCVRKACQNVDERIPLHLTRSVSELLTISCGLTDVGTTLFGIHLTVD